MASKESPVKRDASKGRKRIVLVEDHAMVREGMREAIEREADLTVCGEADSAFHALEVINDTRPHLAIVDLALKGADGLDLIKDIRLRHPGVLVLVVSMYSEMLFAARALRNGASGYICKQEASETLVRAIRRVLAGEIYLTEPMATQIAAQIVGRSHPVTGLPIDKFSNRELQVFKLIGEGRSTREIATTLHLDVSTVESYRARIKEKLHLANAGEVLHAAIEWTHGSALR
jgi:DNA-binding NarL/FixJ family response regulator